MAMSRTFKFSECMHINVENKNMHKINRFVRSLRVKGLINKF